MSSLNNNVYILIDIINQSVNELHRLGFDEAKLEVEVLFEHILGMPIRECLKKKKHIEASIYLQFCSYLEKRKKHYPIAYITHEKAFLSSSYYIPYKVFIPRPETEILVEYSINLIKHHNIETILDIGCGSGVIACELAKAFPQKKIWAFDISKRAIQATQKNAYKQKLKNITLVHQNISTSKLFYSLLGPQSFIVSNPPYISYNEKHLMDKDVILHEPQKALYASKSGLSVINKLIDASLKYKSYFLLEIGFSQASKLK